RPEMFCRAGSLSRLSQIVVVAMLAPICVLVGTAQDAARSTSRTRTSRVQRLPSGQPDLQGIWNFATMTPLERPPAFASKETFTEAEAAEFAQKVLQD